MEQEIKLDAQLPGQLEQVAREQRRNPARLLQEIVREYLEIYEDENLFRQRQHNARRSSYREEDAVDLVRQVRQEVRASWRVVKIACRLSSHHLVGANGFLSEIEDYYETTKTN